MEKVLPITVRCEFAITDPTGRVTQWKQTLRDNGRQDTVGDVLRKHDAIQKDSVEHRFFQYWAKRDDTRDNDRSSSSMRLYTGGVNDTATVAVFETELGGCFDKDDPEARDTTDVRLEIRVTLNTILEDAIERPVTSPHNKTAEVPKDGSTNAFNIMMNMQKSTHQKKRLFRKTGLPEKRREGHGKDRLHNALVSYCMDNKVCLNTHVPQRKRKEMWNLLIKSLWKLNEIEATEWSKAPPEDLEGFLGFSFFDRSDSRGKRKRPSLTNELLDELSGNFRVLLDETWLNPDESGRLVGFLNGMMDSVTAQSTVL